MFLCMVFDLAKCVNYTNDSSVDVDPPIVMASFYDRPEIKNRKGGIDVSKHSKAEVFHKLFFIIKRVIVGIT